MVVQLNQKSFHASTLNGMFFWKYYKFGVKYGWALVQKWLHLLSKMTCLAEGPSDGYFTSLYFGEGWGCAWCIHLLDLIKNSIFIIFWVNLAPS